MNYNYLTSLVLFTSILIIISGFIIIFILKYLNIITPIEKFNNRNELIKAYKGLDEKDPDDQPDEETGNSRIIDLL